MEQCDRRVLSFFELCDNSPDSVATLEASFRSALEQMGFRYYACCSHVDPFEHTSDAVMLQNYPAARVRRFSDAKLHRIDPVLKHAESRTSPFSWDNTFSLHPLTTEQRNVLSEGATLGLAHVRPAVISVCGPPLIRGVRLPPRDLAQRCARARVRARTGNKFKSLQRSVIVGIRYQHRFLAIRMPTSPLRSLCGLPQLHPSRV